MEGWRATTSASSRGTHHVFDWDVYDGREKWMLCFDFQQIGTEPLAQRAPVKTRHFSTEWQWRAEWILLGCKQMYVSNKQSPHLDIWKSLLKEKLFAFYYTIQCGRQGEGGKSQFFQHYLQAFAHVKQTSDLVSYWPGKRSFSCVTVKRKPLYVFSSNLA